MGEVFIKLLNVGITAGWLILAVVCVRLLFRKMPKWVICLLWGLVAIRLLLPFSVESDFSLQPSAEPIKINAVVDGEIIPYVPSVDSNLSIVEETVNPILAEVFAYQDAESVAPMQIVAEAAGILWILGMLGFWIYAAGSAVRLRLCVREAVHYKKNIYICDGVSSPFILGVVRPRIYLSSALSQREAEYILVHEKAHLKRKDYLWKPIAYLLLSIYWFQPLCWLAYMLLCKDIELACDEKVIQNMTFGDKKEYSRVLLSCATRGRLVFVCPLAFGEVGVRERVRLVLYYKKPAFWITIAAIALSAVIAVCFLTNPSGEHKDRTTIPAESVVKENDVKENNVSSEEKQISETVVPLKEDVLAMRETVLEGMSEEEIDRLTENIKVANLRLESAYLYDNVFGKLSDQDSLYWNYFEQKGEIQIGQKQDGTPVTVYNRFDADNFVNLIQEMQRTVQNEALVADLQQLIDLTVLAKETHEVEYANSIYKILHDLDYFLLRYGIEDVGKYVMDASVVSKYYGVLVVYGAEPLK